MRYEHVRLVVPSLLAFFWSYPGLARGAELATDQTRVAEFYAPGRVQTIELTISQENLQRMRDALPQRIFVPAKFRHGKTTFGEVGVRYKGNSSSRARQRHKRSFLIRFDKYRKKLRFLGLRRISLDNGVQFGSLFSEPIVTAILRAEKIKTHRANYARLMLNGKFHGVYVNVERIDRVFIANHLGGNDGGLFKVDLGGPGGDLRFIGPATGSYERTFETKSKGAKASGKRIMQLIQTINRPRSPESDRAFRQAIEVDDFLRTMAVMLFAGAFDQLTGWNPHNYYLYCDSKTNRWRYLPWDLDVGFSDRAFGRIPVIDGWHAAWPAPGPRPSPILERVLADPDLLRRYRQHAKRILEAHFRPQDLHRRLDKNYELIKADLAKDPFPNRRVTNPRDRGYASIVASIKQFMTKRYELARRQLENPGQRPPKPQPRRSPFGDRGPRPGPKSKLDPTRLSAQVKNGVVHLNWQDNAKNKVAYVLQRAEGQGAFRNRKAQPGLRPSRIDDARVVKGKTYRYRIYAIIRTKKGGQATGVSNVVTVTVK